MTTLPRAEYGDQATRWSIASGKFNGRRVALLTLTARNSRKTTVVMGWRLALAVVWGLLLGLARG